MVDEAELAAIGKRRARAKVSLDRATTEAKAAVKLAIDAGVSEADAARILQVDRMTVRSWLGKKR